MCIGLSRRSVPTGGFSPKHSDVALFNQMAVKPQFNASTPTNFAGLSAFLNNSTQQAASLAKKSLDSKHHITVEHNYHDHANDAQVEARRLPARGGVITPFPLKLHTMLDGVEKEGLEHIVSWQPHGRCFVVRDPKEFVNILAKYFKVSKVSSFQRQLNLYGFQRLTKGRDKGGYYHELFLRGRVFLAHNIQRVKVKGTKIRARSNPAQEPNFYSMPWVASNSSSSQQQVMPVKSMPQEQDLEPLDPLAQIPASIWDLEDSALESSIPSSMWEGEDVVDASEADAFFQDFDFPKDSSPFDDIENDDIFGDLLEKMIS